jgi:glucose/arabinose dehydrogenase
MKSISWKWTALAAVVVAAAVASMASESDIKSVTTGTAAFVTYKDEKPGTYRKITVADLPQPYATEGVANGPTVVPMPSGAWPKAPEGFKVERYAEMTTPPRELRTAPNGDLFVSDSSAGQIEVFRGITKDGKPEQNSVFVTGLKNNFGIAFYPLGKNPEWIYLANTGSVIRYRYPLANRKPSLPNSPPEADTGRAISPSLKMASASLCPLVQPQMSIIPIRILPRSIAPTFSNSHQRASS